MPGRGDELEQVAKLPLVLPPLPKHRRIVIDRAFEAAGLAPNIIAETDAALSELSAVRSGVGEFDLQRWDV